MLVSLATFEHLPIRVGGLAEAVTSLGESLLKYADVMVLMPAHGLLQEEKNESFAHRPLEMVKPDIVHINDWHSYLNEQWPNFFSTFEGKTTYVWNGADYSFWDPQELEYAHLPRSKRRARMLQDYGLPEGVLFFNVGRLDAAQKGIDVLLNAFEMIMQNEVPGAEKVREQIRFVLLGSGDPQLEQAARRLEAEYPQNMKAIVEYLGREATREFYGAADFCIIPSNFEPFGLVQLEAMCMGCIPIGTQVGGINDTVIDLHHNKEESTGRLVPPRNSASLASAMVEMASRAMADEDVLQSMRLRGREHVIKNFNWDKAAQRYLLAYENKATVKLPFVSYAEPY